MPEVFTEQPPTATTPDAPLPFNQGAWNQRLQAARLTALDRVQRGRTMIDRYLVQPLDWAPKQHTSTVPHDYFMVEQKKAQLFYQVPEVFLSAARPDAEDAAPLLAAVLNQKILPAKGVNAQALIDAMVFDLVCPMGFAACKIGYEATTRMAPQPPPIDPATGQPMLDADGIPLQPQMKPTVISERYFADRIPPGRLRLPVEWLGGDLDTAPWVAFDFYETDADGRGSSAMTEFEDLLQGPPQNATLQNRRRTTEVWYRATTEDPTAHPDEIRYFQLKEGESEPTKHAKSPNQFVKPDGKLGGMMGYPIGLLTLRTISDRATPPPDTHFTRGTFDELSITHTQQIQRRTRALPQTFIDATRFGTETLEQIEKNENTAFIPVNGPLDPSAVLALDKGRFGPENAVAHSTLERQGEQAWALGSNQQGVQTKGARTATELQLIQANVDTRLDKERGQILTWFCEKFVPKLAALVQMFADETDYVAVLGDDAAPRLVAWNKTQIQGDFTFTVQAGSSQRHDARSEQKRALDLYNLGANDPQWNGVELRRMVARAYGSDAARLIVKAPPPQPEKPKISISIKGEDLNPQMPQYPNVLLILQLNGVQGLQNAAQPQEPISPANPAEPIDSHFADETGQLSGGGAIAAGAGRVQ